MSFNIRVKTPLDLFNGWSGRRDIATQAITSFNPDLLAVQECLDSQKRDLLHRLPHMAFVGTGRNNGKPTGGEMCGIFYRTDRFTLLNHGFIWLSKTPHTPGSKSFGSWWPRMATWALLQPRDGSPPFLIASAHLDIANESVRRQQAQVLKNHLTTLASAPGPGTSRPIILAGDFNTTDDSSTHQILRSSESPLIDAHRALHPRSPDENTHHGYGGSPRGPRIDWILASPHFKPLSATIVRHHHRGKYPSDHFPITAELVPSPPSASPASAHADP
jgi:endonuclease/exonuclease/phosphatase family metal-dependent hydrolase